MLHKSPFNNKKVAKKLISAKYIFDISVHLRGMYGLPGKLLVEVLEAEVAFSNWAQAKAKKVKANRGFQSEKNRGWYFSEPSDLLFIFLHALHILLIAI